MKYDKKITDCGLFIYKERPYLGSSPDGVTEDGDLIEIKCPYSCVHLTPEEGVRQNKIKFLEEKVKTFILKRNENYYYQIQGQLAITGRRYCYFIVWTPLGMVVRG